MFLCSSPTSEKTCLVVSASMADSHVGFIDNIDDNQLDGSFL
jgi:hypothetical protein